MSKFHVNPATGEASKCAASKGKCPFGSPEEHFSSQEEASQFYEHKVSKMIEAFNAKNAILGELDGRLSKLSFQLDAIRKRVNAGTSKDLTEDLSRLKAMEELKRELTDSIRNAWYDREQALKVLSDNNLAGSLPKYDAGTKAAKEANMKYVRTMKLNVNFNEMKDHYRPTLIDEYASWAGLSRSEAARELDAYDEKSGMTKDEYVVSLFQNNIDEAKERVYLDLETSGFHPTTGEIIEIGMVRVNGKGEVIEEIKERFDISRPDVRDSIGVGPTHIHKIAPEDVKGLPKFTDPEVQERMAKILNNPNAIVVAHNKNFENEFLGQFLTGYDESRNNLAASNLEASQDAAPMTDTRALAGFLVHSIPNNKLESFALANKVAYANAHTAIDDARMTFQALESFKKSVREAEAGTRPVLTWENMPAPK